MIAPIDHITYLNERYIRWQRVNEALQKVHPTMHVTNRAKRSLRRDGVEIPGCFD